MISKTSKIAITMAVILFTALAIYRVELPIPPKDLINDPEDLKYRHYLLLREGLLSAFVIGNMAAYFIGYKNVAIKCCLIFNASLFCYIVFKNEFMVPDQHSMFDWSVLGGVVIYLINLYWKDLLTLTKAIINEIYIKCQLPKKRVKGE